MWYLAHLLFAERPQANRKRSLCESCHVLLQAKSAVKCFDRATIWARRHEKESGFKFVGVQHIKPLDKKRPGDGDEIGGRFLEAYNIWKRVDKFIPSKKDIPIIKLESNSKTAVGRMMSPKQKQIAHRLFGN
jgi:hypothetical protein